MLRFMYLLNLILCSLFIFVSLRLACFSSFSEYAVSVEGPPTCQFVYGKSTEDLLQ